MARIEMEYDEYEQLEKELMKKYFKDNVYTLQNRN